MPKRGLPTGIKMRHDAHYVEELTHTHRSVGRTIPIDKLFPNPEQPRVEIGDLTELSSSIKQKGILEPILVKPLRESATWLIIAGERRWRAAKLAGLEEVPCIELDLSEQEIAEIALIENLQRKDLTIWEVADGLASLAEKFDYTHEDIAKRIGKSRTTVTESLTIAGLPDEVRRKCLAAGISAKSILLEIARQFDEAAMHQFLENISDLNRKAIRHQARPKNKTAADETKIIPAHNTFSFRSKEYDFELNIKFFNRPDLEDQIILKALKATFDEVKGRNRPASK